MSRCDVHPYSTASAWEFTPEERELSDRRLANDCATSTLTARTWRTFERASPWANTPAGRSLFFNGATNTHRMVSPIHAEFIPYKDLMHHGKYHEWTGQGDWEPLPPECAQQAIADAVARWSAKHQPMRPALKRWLSNA